MKSKIILLAVILVGTASCTSNTSDPSSTTIDPKIVELEKAVQDLQAKLNATTLPPPSTEAHKPARSITDSGTYLYTSSGFAPNKKYLCKDYVNYSDGTSEITNEYWITEDMYKANNGCP